MHDEHLLDQILALRDDLLAAPVEAHDVHPVHRASACNLEHFLRLRSVDRRELQDRLAATGVSSLGRCEPHVLSTVESVVSLLRARNGAGSEERDQVSSHPNAPDYREGTALLDANSVALFGPPPRDRTTRIMVTLPSQAATDADLVETYVRRGMDVARINCAHDDIDAWRAMAHNVRDAARRASRDVRIFMDLAGPKLRTGRIEPGPAVVKIRPERDQLGRVRQPAQLLLTSSIDDGCGPGLPRIPVDSSWLASIRPGDTVHLADARRATRAWHAVRVEHDGVVVESTATTYVTNGTELIHGDDRTRVTGLAPTPGHIDVDVGDTLVLTTDPAAVAPGAGRIGCTLPAVVAALDTGHRVFFDDGKIGGVVESTAPGEAKIRIDFAPHGGARLRAQKGVNVPDTTVSVPALTGADEHDLASIVDLADMVGLSFVRHPSDVEALQQWLAHLGASDLGIVLRIETKQGFRSLPSLVRTAMRSARVGVMIARGDLAVEVGYQRLAEVQEEILWLCEAAHLPVIWATDVLDRLAKTGRPSRSEITDAAMSERAECVMLNKGAHAAEAIRVLDDILVRMTAHQRKKRSLLRRLGSWTAAES